MGALAMLVRIEDTAARGAGSLVHPPQIVLHSIGDRDWQPSCLDIHNGGRGRGRGSGESGGLRLQAYSFRHRKEEGLLASSAQHHHDAAGTAFHVDRLDCCETSSCACTRSLTLEASSLVLPMPNLIEQSPPFAFSGLCLRVPVVVAQMVQRTA